MRFGIIACYNLGFFSQTCHMFIYTILGCYAVSYQVSLQRFMKRGSELNPLVYIGTSNTHSIVRFTALHIRDASETDFIQLQSKV